MIIPNKANIKGKIVQMYGTQDKFAEAIGVTVVTVGYKLNGQRPFMVRDLPIWAKALGIKDAEIGQYFKIK